jgi:hypothetical protein
MTKKQGHQSKSGKRESYERQSAREMNQKLKEALERLWEPPLNYRTRRNNFIKSKSYGTATRDSG